jgi:hypothetical protein
VTGLQQAIKPRLPRAPPSVIAEQQKILASNYPQSRLFRGGVRDAGHVAFTDFDKASDPSEKVDWQRLAHVQLARNHHDVCSAIMVLAEFHRMRSPARRLLLFPEEWAAERDEHGRAEITDPFIDSSRRLLRLAARRYGVELRPVRPLVKRNEEGVEVKIYSMESAFALTDFDRVLSIELPGLVLDASPLDAVLAFTEPAPFALLHDTAEGDGVHPEDLFLIQPSLSTRDSLKDFLKTQPSRGDTLLSQFFNDPLLLDSNSTESALVRSIGTLHDVDPDFNSTAYISDVAYMRFSDPKLPGPEYDVNWSQKRAARPQNKDADWVWTKLYGEFAQRRMDVCGLDLETWRP